MNSNHINIFSWRYCVFVCLRAGKNEEDDNTTQPVIENDNNLIPQCKEDWEGSWAPPVAAPDHVPPATASKEQPTNPPQTSNTSAGNKKDCWEFFDMAFIDFL